MQSRKLAGVHRVGILASGAGLIALLTLSFGRVRSFRLATGDPVAIFEALPLTLALVPVVLWLVAATFSIVSAHSKAAAFVRGLAGSGVVVALLWLSGWAAGPALRGVGTFARYSIGAGVWASLFFALTLVIDSRRGVGLGSWRSMLVVGLAPVGVVVLVLSGTLSSLGMAAEYRNVADEFWMWTSQHVLYALVSMGLALTAGLTLGIVAYRNRRIAQPIFAATSIVQTIPGLAMIGILAVPLGMAGQATVFRSLGIGVLGWAPVVVALTLYALLVLVRNTYSGLMSVPEPTIEAGRGMGLTGAQLLRKVELPLASPIIFTGTRTAFQQTIGNATLAYFVAAGSLGRPIFSGVAQQANDLVLLGSVTLVVLAVFVDIVLRGAERLVTPTRTGGMR